MNRRLPVQSLEDLCGARLRRWVHITYQSMETRDNLAPTLRVKLNYSCFRYLTDHCWTVAKIYRGIEIDEIVNREENLPLHIEELRNAIFEVYTLMMTVTVVQLSLTPISRAFRGTWTRR